MSITYNELQALYLGLFDRPAEAAGEDYWYAQTGTASSIANTIGGYAKYSPSDGKNAPGDLVSITSSNITNEITNIYTNLLGFTPAAGNAGVAYWAGLYTAGTLSIGQIVDSIFNIVENLTSGSPHINEKTYMDNAIATATAYTQANANVTYSQSAYLAEGQTIITTVPTTTDNLTTGIDNITAVGNTTINGILDSSTIANATFTNLDTIKATGTGNVFNISDLDASGSTMPSLVTVSGVQTVNYVSTGVAGGLDYSGWTGLTALNVTETGGTKGVGITAASSTAVTVTDSAQAAGTIDLDGGSNVTVNSAADTTGAINIGVNTAPTGTVNVTTGIAASNTGGLITIDGGTTVNVTENMTNANGTTVTAESAVYVNGGSATTTVTVAQATVQAAESAVAAVSPIVAVTGVSAAPGTNAVTAVANVGEVVAVTAQPGVTVDGAVHIIDSNFNTATANTITTVNLTNYGASFIQDNALTTLSLTDTSTTTGGTLGIQNATSGATKGTLAAAGTPNTNTTLNLTVNGLTGSNTITDENNEIKTLNVTTAGNDSTLAAFADTGLKTLKVSGTNVLTLSTINASLTTLNVSGAAGFNDGGTTAGSGLAALGSALTITDTSSGTFTAVLDATTQTFTGSTGQDVITISDLAANDATKTITGGSATNNELILDGGTFGLTAANTGANVTGFEILGITSTVNGTVDMSKLSSGFTSLDVQGGGGTIAVTHLAQHDGITIDAAETSLTVNYADANGLNDTVGVTLGAASTTAAGFITGTLALADANSVGIGTLNVVSNGANITTSAGTASYNYNSITTLTDNGLSALNVSGTAGLYVGTLNESANQATTFTINNTSTGGYGVDINALTDSKLGNIIFQGSGNDTIGTLTTSGGTITTMNVTNSGTGTGIISGWTDPNITSLTLTGNLNITSTMDSLTSLSLSNGQTFNLTDTNTNGIAISGTSDNSHVRLDLSGTAASSAAVDTIKLGNANNNITDTELASKVNVTVGTGSNLIVLGSATSDTTGAYNVTLGAHTATTGIDSISIGTAGSDVATPAPNLIVTGAVTGDTITLAGDTTVSTNLVGTGLVSGAGTITATTITANTAPLAIGQLETAVAATAEHIAVGIFGNNTYIVESNATASASGANTTIIEIVGSHTISTTAGTAGGLHLLTIAS